MLRFHLRKGQPSTSLSLQHDLYPKQSEGNQVKLLPERERGVGMPPGEGNQMITLQGLQVQVNLVPLLSTVFDDKILSGQQKSYSGNCISEAHV